MAVYVSDERAFMASDDIQRLNIGTFLTQASLMPQSIKPLTNTAEHNFTSLSILVTPEDCLSFINEFFCKFSPTNSDVLSGDLLLEIRVKAENYWQTKVKFLMDKRQDDDLQSFFTGKGHFLRRRDCRASYCLPDFGGLAFIRAKKGIDDKRGMLCVNDSIKSMLDFPSLDTNSRQYSYQKFNIDPTSCVTQTIETIGVPFPSANEITLEMICNAMMQVKSNKSMTAYQCYIQETADLRDMKGYDLPATILSSVSSLDTPQ